MSGRVSILLLLPFALFLTDINAQKMPNDGNIARIVHIAHDFDISAAEQPAWNPAPDIAIDHYWSGAVAPKGRHASVRMLWSDKALYVRFIASQTEPLVISATPDTSKKTLGLWDRDVCEIFVAPDVANPNRYFEFELAPTGEWVDLGIEVLPDKRNRDDNYASGMQSFANVEAAKVILTMRIEWRAFRRTPKPGESWRGNLFRCVGKDPDRGYLAWQPTLTKEPAFHLPDKFGLFLFVKQTTGKKEAQLKQRA